MENEDNKKRAREEFEYFESDTNLFPFSKLARLDSAESTHVEPDLNDLLNFLDDSDSVIGPEPGIQELDSVLKSFEEEILVPNPATLPIISSESDEPRPDLGFLFGASDDELGLPPSFSSVEPGKQFGNVDDVVGEMMGYELPSSGYEAFELGIGGDSVADNDNNRSNNVSDFVTLGGLFEPDAGNFGAYAVT